jgi:CheY-like chemotaxis protein
MDFDGFVAQLTDAYEHIYDLVYLRTHPLTPIFARGKSGTAKDHAWITHHLLLDIIQELDPGNAPISSREWRRHRLLSLRYADGLAAQAVADQLAISRRHYYRAHEEAIQAIAQIVWQRFEADAGSEATKTEAIPSEKAVPDRMELMRLEAAQLSQVHPHTDIAEVLDGVFVLLDQQIQEHKLDIQRASRGILPSVSADPRLLRQLLLALVGYLVERSYEGTLVCQLEAAEGDVRLGLTVEPTSAIQDFSESEHDERLSALEELATLCNVMVTPTIIENAIVGFCVNLPLLKSQPTILVIDDNDDILELVQRYLRSNHYEAITAKNAQQALDKVEGKPPSAIILDLMMPDRDGWDLLQFFLHQPATQATPVIVCSVLRQKELALSLGAAAFLVKPISEQQLISTLEAVIGENRQVG